MNNEELDSQLSAMFDDELPAAECQLLARRLARDEQLKARWGRYAVISAAIRAERGVRLDSTLARRVSQAIAAEPPLSAQPAAGTPHVRGGRWKWWQPIVGAAVAASVATLSVMWLRSTGLPGQPAAPATGPVVAATTATEAIAEPESYVVPTTVEPPAILPTAVIANYVVAHSEYSTSLGRRNLLSALVASEAGTAGGFDESDDPFEDATYDGQIAE